MRLGWLLLLLAAASCLRPLRGDLTVCPEFRDLRCATAPECSMQKERGCRVCQCRSPYGVEVFQTNPLPPDLRVPR